jgi:hypothetical protein
MTWIWRALLKEKQEKIMIFGDLSSKITLVHCDRRQPKMAIHSAAKISEIQRIVAGFDAPARLVSLGNLTSDGRNISIKKHVLRKTMPGIVVLFAVSDLGK